MRKDNGSLNNIEIVRLKEKLGTRQLPTAELVLDGTEAYLISEPGEGVKFISPMLTITRLYNSTFSVSYARRLVALLKDYSLRRKVFG